MQEGAGNRHPSLRCPPDRVGPWILAGLLRAMPRRAPQGGGLRSTSLRASFAHPTGARQRFLQPAVRWENRLNCWKTMPVSQRIRSMLRRSLGEGGAVRS